MKEFRGGALREPQPYIPCLPQARPTPPTSYMRTLHQLLRLGKETAADLYSLFDLEGQYEWDRGLRVSGYEIPFLPVLQFLHACMVRTLRLTSWFAANNAPPETADKPEAVADGVGHLVRWMEIYIVRHHDIDLLEETTAANVLPMINMMTDGNHACYALFDSYALSETNGPLKLLRPFVGAKGNILPARQEATCAFQIDMTYVAHPYW